MSILTPQRGKSKQITSPLSEALAYHQLDFKCPFCGIKIIFPKIIEEERNKEEEMQIRCPRCHKLLKIKIVVEKIYTVENLFNPSRRY